MSQKLKREQIKVLSEVGKNTPRDISQLLSVSLATVYNTLNRVKTGRTFEHGVGAGRPAVKYYAIKGSLSQQIRRSKGAKTIKDMHVNLNIAVSKPTVKRALARLQYKKVFPVKTFMLSEKNRIKRMDWGRKYEKKYCRNAIFCDEASFLVAWR